MATSANKINLKKTQKYFILTGLFPAFNVYLISWKHSSANNETRFLFSLLANFGNR